MKYVIEQLTNVVNSHFIKYTGDHKRKFVLVDSNLVSFKKTVVSVPFVVFYYASFKEYKGRAIFDRSTSVLKQIIWDKEVD